MMYLEFNRVRVDHAAVFCGWLTSSNSAISKTSPFKSIGSFPETVSKHEVESKIRVIGIDTELLLNTVNSVFHVITVHVQSVSGYGCSTFAIQVFSQELVIIGICNSVILTYSIKDRSRIGLQEQLLMHVII